MKKRKNIFILITIVLLTMSIILVLLFGNKITLRLDLSKYKFENDDISLHVEQEDEVVKVLKSEKVGNEYLVTLKSVKKGNAYIELKDGSDNYYYYHKIYVHKSNIITVDNYFGKTRGDIFVPISFFIITAYAIYILVEKYRDSMKKNIYQYRNVTYLSTIIFLVFFLINQLFIIFDYNGLIYTIENVESTISGFTIVSLPVAFLTFIFVTITNIILMKKEGFTWKNMLGTILGILICLLTIIPELLNRMTFNTTIMKYFDVHNEKGTSLYIFKFIITSISLVVSYLECILLGTIVLGVKAAKNEPKYDKDYIIILGCMIRKNGSLTKLLKGRVDRAIEFREKQMKESGKDLIFIPSGGKGKNEPISEALAMKNYLVDKGIKNKSIIIEDQSTTTLENLKNSYKIINNKKAKIAFSTTGYHVFRAGILATELKYNIEGMGSRTKTYFGINAFIREFVATLNTERNKHIKMILLLLFIVLLVIVTQYLGAIL